MWFENNIENITAIATVLIAAIAIFIAIWQIITTRIHNKLSVVPHLLFETIIDEKPNNVNITLKNVGIGPAIIKSYDVYLDGTKQDLIDGSSWLIIVEKAGFKAKYIFGLKLDIDNSAVGVNEEKQILLIELLKPQKMTEVQKALKRINIKINYECIYGKHKDVELYSDL